MTAKEQAAPAIVVFDAQCVLCSANARLILRNDRQRRFRLASMQEAAGAQLLRQHGVDPNDPDTIIVVAGNDVHRDSDAVLYIYRSLGMPWRLVGLFRAVPRPLRDRAYRFIARNRYRLFGKLDQCWVPDASDRDRML